MEKVLYYKEYDSPITYGYKPEHRVKSYVKLTLHLNFKNGLWFSVTIPNAGYGNRNPFKAIFRALEHESIGMAKYQKMKDDTRACGLYKSLDCK